MDNFIQLFCLVFVSVLAFSRGECPQTYFEGPNGHCYVDYNSTYGSTWDSARRSCADTNNSDLVIIDDQAEYDWLVNLTTTEAPNSFWWIGYHDSSAEGDWRWVDCGETTDWHRTLWSSGNHDNEAEDCGVLLPTGEIDDIVCDTPVNYFVCEVKPKDFTPDEASPTNLRANVSSTLTVSLTWDVSPLSCDVYAYRVRVTDDQMATSSEIVYGGDTSEVDVSVDRVRTQYSFTVAALTIMDGELAETDPALATTDPCPDDFEESPGGRCYQFRSLTNGEWWPAGRRSCDNTQDGDLVIINDEAEWNFIKNRSSEIDPDAMWWIGLSDLTSDDDWRWVDCSEPIDWQNRLWAPGYPTMDDKDCAILHPDGTITNDVCDLRINSICEVSPKEFDGDTLMVKDVMISGSSTTSLDVTWSLPRYSCDAVGYRIYYSMMDTMEEKESIFVQGGDVTHDVVPDLRANTTYHVTVAIYTNKANELGESLAAQGTTMACPADYEEGPNGHCYWFGMTDFGNMWYWGRLDCSDQPDSDLVIIDDEEELDFLRNRTSELSTVRDWWIGLSSSPEWSWVNCEEPNPWQNTLWAPGNPRPESYGCTVLDDSGELVDVACDSKHHFICEIYPRGFSGEDQNVEDIEVSPLMYGMEVSWTLAPKHCDVDHYKISYSEDMDGAEELFAIQYGDDSTSTTVTGLYPNRTYNVTVAAVLTTGLGLSPVGPVQVTTLACPADYEEGPNGHCYWFGMADFGNMWYWGRLDCSDQPDSDLVIIDDEEELGFLRNRTSELSTVRDWWIGLSSSPEWSWVNCEEPNPWQNTLWAPGNPRPESYGCTVLDDSGELVDVACDSKHHFICEIYPRGFSGEDQNVEDIEVSPLMYGMEVSWTLAPKHCDVDHYKISYSEDMDGAEELYAIQYGDDSTSTTVTGLYPDRTYNVTVAAVLTTGLGLSPVGPVQVTTPACPDNYEEGPSGHCYRFRILDNGTRWMRGRQTCDNVEDSDYAIIDDQEELNYLLNRSAEVDPDMTWWIGFSDLSMPGSWGWVDCSPLTPWQTGLWTPDYPTGLPSRCGALLPDGGVIDLPCQTRLSYLCELFPKGFDADAIMVRNVTAEGQSNFIVVSWDLPENSCDVIGYIIYYQLSDGTGDRKSMYINGGQSTTSGAIRALPLGTSYSITVAVSTSKEMELQETAPINATTSSSCPDDYEEGPNGHCYRFWLEDSGYWWGSTRRGCTGDVDYSDLLVINDQEEYDFVMNRTAELSVNDTWWIGYTDQSVEGDWRWIDCQQSDEWQNDLWAPGYPSNGAHDCAVLQPTGDVIDVVCDALVRGFVCEIASREFDWEDGNVQDLMATGIMYGLEVTWSGSPVSCDVIGYRVTYQLDEPGSESEFMIVYGGDEDSVTITGLLPERRYTVGVAAILNVDSELPPVFVTGNPLTCPNNYEEGPNGHCYRFRILDPGSHWPTGRRTCDNVEDSDLAVINDPEELAFLVNRGAEVDPDVTWWIGLSDLYIEGEWRWVDCSTSTPYQETLWGPDYPSDAGLTCAALQPSGDVINLPCDRRFSYLCELYPKGFDLSSQVVKNVSVSGGMYTIDVAWELPEDGCNAVGYKIYYALTGVESDVLRSVFISGGDSVSGSVTGLRADASYEIKVAIYTSKDTELGDTEAVNVSTAACPDNYELGPNGRCYRFRLHDTGSWWSGGRRVCDNVVDSDLVIIDDEIEFDFVMNRTAELDPNEHWWIGYTDQSVEGDWRWIDCEASNTFQRTLWAPGYPGNGAHDCAALRPSGDIVDLVCDASLSYICEISPKGFGNDDINPHDLAASGVTYGLEVTWTLSPTSCDAIGYRVTYQQDVPGSSVEFVIVYGGDAQSETVQGLLPGRSYNVSVAAILNQDYELDPIDPVTATTLPCPGGYEEGPNGRCYRFRIRDPGFGSWWSTGRRTCDNELDSDLAIINDQEELDFLINRTAQIDPDIMWWIGYSDQSVEGDWRWIDCVESSAWQDALWVPDHPGNGRLDCAALQPDGQILDLVCDTPLSYLCEVSPRGFSQEDGNPSDLAVMGTTYGLEVTWTVSPTSCDVVGYRISYYLTGDISTRASTVVYGGDTSSAVVRGLAVNTTYDVTVAAFISKDIELSPIGPLTATTDSCPVGYDLAPNGRCYLFIQESLGSFWHYSRQTCWGQKDSDLAIINDQDELDYMMQQIADIADAKAWWLGYSDNSVEGEWKWVDCTESNDWQMNLWGPGSPGNQMMDCGALASSGEVEAEVCDLRLNFVCEVSPKGFDPMELKVENLAVSGASYGVDVSWSLPENNCDAYAYKIYYQEVNSDMEQFKILYGGDTVGARIQGLLPNTTLNISVAVLIVDDELKGVGPIIGQSDPCPTSYEEAANGRCYWFQDFGRYGNDWNDVRSYCSEAAENFDHDLMIIDDEWELEYITNRTREFNDTRDWRIGYSDLAEEGVWKWVTCQSPDTWQQSLWAPGYPQNGQDDCGVFDPDTMTIYDQVCDFMDINFICEVTPKDFSPGDDNVFNLNATAIAWDTIRVTWNVSEYNCDVIAYNIFYLDTYLGGEPKKALVYGGEVESYDLTMLQPSTRYSISVSAERQDQELPQVDPVYATTPEGPCPPYYVIGPNSGCYRFVTSEYGSMWSSGRSGCGSIVDSDLVVIDDQMELDFIVNHTKEFDSRRDWWIGFSDFSVESDWRWVTCDAPSDWQNTLWEPGYPGNGDCGALSSSSRQVVDAVCDDRKYYICEITPKGFTDADMNVHDVMASPVSSTEIQVTWMLSNVTCNVYGYKIYYGMQGEPFEITQFHLVYGGNMTSITIPGLSPSMTYRFYVAALIPDRLELPMIGPTNATTYSECQRTIVDKDGMIMNVDYPNGYAGPETCEWLISAPIDQYVLLQILDFDTRAGTDFVVIGSGVDFASETTLYVLSGSKANAGGTPIPDKVLSPGQDLWISFKTSESTLDHAGFQMQVTMVTQGPGEPERQYDEISEEGTLSSPGWPDQYQNFVDLTWTLIAPKTGRVRITSMEGILESNYDRLTIGYGNPDSSILNTFTGDFKVVETLESPTYNLWVRFQADETVSNKGFTLYWESFDDQDSCGTQELLEASGTVMSPNYPQAYPDNQECTWLIRLPSMDQLVRVEFTAFSLEENHDFLVIGTGKTINEEVISILTGDLSLAPIESESYRMWLQFKSDESFSATGFSLEYTGIDNPNPPTQYNEIADTVIFIVQNEPLGWFTPTNQEDLANAIATSMTDYCMDKSDTCQEIASERRKRDANIFQLTFSLEDVQYLDEVAVENDLHITLWVRNPSMVNEDVVIGIEPEIVQTSLQDETSQSTIKETMGEGFDYNVTPNVQAPTDPSTTPSPGLEPWAISLIVVASVAVVVTAVVGLEVRHRRKMKRKSLDMPVLSTQEFAIHATMGLKEITQDSDLSAADYLL